MNRSAVTLWFLACGRIVGTRLSESLSGLSLRMELDLGGLSTHDSPTVDDVRHFLKYMPAESPFVMLSDANGFIQATHTGLEFQVEYSVDNGHTQYYCLADYETACDLFLDFRAGNVNYKSSAEWKRLKPQTIWNKSSPIVISILCIICVMAIAVMVWQTFQ